MIFQHIATNPFCLSAVYNDVYEPFEISETLIQYFLCKSGNCRSGQIYGLLHNSWKFYSCKTRVFLEKYESGLQRIWELRYAVAVKGHILKINDLCDLGLWPFDLEMVHDTSPHPREQGSWGQHGAHLGPVGPMLAPWTLLSGMGCICAKYEANPSNRHPATERIWPVTVRQEDRQTAKDDKSIELVPEHFDCKFQMYIHLTHWGRDKIAAISDYIFKCIFLN